MWNKQASVTHIPGIIINTLIIIKSRLEWGCGWTNHTALQICCSVCRILFICLLESFSQLLMEQKKRFWSHKSSGLIPQSFPTVPWQHECPLLSPSIGLLMGKLCAIIPFYRMAVSQTCGGWCVAMLYDYICILCKTVSELEVQICPERRFLVIHKKVKLVLSMINICWSFGFSHLKIVQIHNKWQLYLC